MPLFRSGSRSNGPAPPPAQSQPPVHRSGGFFSRRSDSPESYHNGNSSVRSSPTHSSGGGFFSRRRSSSSSSSSGHANLKHDPSIIAARQKVTDAKAAETLADRALNDARAAVRSAKDQVRILEQEALDEARRAKLKQAEAKTIKKSTGRLGRHG